MRIAAPILLAALGGCMTVPVAGEPITIAYETSRCFGACPVYRVTVSSNGEGTFHGMRYTAVTGERRFTITPAQFRAFERHLAPLRPASGLRSYAGENCRSMATDLPAADVAWDESGERQRLHFYYGCDMERNRAIAERLNQAPQLLPIGEWIGSPAG